MQNLKPSYDVKTYGTQSEKVVVIDNFIEDFEAIRQMGRSAQFTSQGGFYPGVQAAGNMNYIAPSSQILLDIIQNVFDFRQGLRVESCAYALVSQPADTLHPLQRIPHYDAQEGELFALLHYIQGPENAGTAFYRHKRTGFETVTPNRADSYQKALEADFKEYGHPQNAYIDGHTDAFEMMLSIKARPNRAIFYRGRTLHSGIIPKDMLLSEDPQKGRMTLNSFLWAA